MDASESLRVHIRSRPAMYIGGVDSGGLRKILDDIVTEQLAEPDARLEVIRCVLGAGGTHAVEVWGGAVAAVEPGHFIADNYDRSPDDRLFSLAVACAFSERFDAEVVRGGRRWSQAFAAGVPVAPPEVSAADAPPLVRVRYRPDPAVFKRGTDPGFLSLCGRAREWAAFHPHVRFTVEDERAAQRRDFHYPEGLLSLAQELEHDWYGHEWTGPAWHCNANEADGSGAEAVFVRRPGDASIVHSFVNGRRTVDGGTHVDGLRRGVAEVAAQLGDGPGSPFRDVENRDPMAGLTVVLSVRLNDPSWGMSTKDLLNDPRAADIVRRMISVQLPAEIARAKTAS
jgi:DNA gyrase subunit B